MTPDQNSNTVTDLDIMEGMISFRSVVSGIRSGVSDRKINKVWFDRKKRRQTAGIFRSSVQ